MGFFSDLDADIDFWFGGKRDFSGSKKCPKCGSKISIISGKKIACKNCSFRGKLN